MAAEAHKVVEIFRRSKKGIELPDREFLGPGLELMATPPSPIRVKLMFAICALFVIALVVSWICRIDIYAVAQARIQPTGRSKVIQPLATGKVLAIRVSNGSRVKEGDVLVELDPTESAADRTADSDQLDSLTAEIARRSVAISAARANDFASLPKIPFDAKIDATIRRREEAVLQADLSQLKATLDSSTSKIAESEAKIAATKMIIEEEEQLVGHLREGVEIRQALQKKGLESQANVIDAQQSLGKELTLLANQRGDILQARAAIESLKSDAANTVAKFISDNTQARTAAQAKRDEAKQNLVKSSAKLDSTRLTAPIDGTVQELAITTIGQVVTAGQQLMTVVPGAADLEAEALVANKDIGFVEPGQPVVVKIDAFPFTRYGTISGRVLRISHDAVDSHEAMSSSDSTSTPISTQSSAAAPTPQTQNLIYPVTVVLDKATISVGGKDLPLAAGMSAKVEIRTGDRRVIDYLLSPIVEVTSETAHER